ncbi:MAG TPA: hypothetical protein VLA99_10675 [Nitrospiraceae bacterium]|nr:hypothetical protein [Nitrospiraceae bacterium]
MRFGPIDLPTGHDGDLAASLPKHVFQLPRDMYLTGYKAALFTEDGTPLPREYLHHILMINLSRESLACPGEVYFFAGAGLEMSEATFPSGYGVELKQSDRLMAVVGFYHEAPPTTKVVASLTMQMAPAGVRLTPLEVYHIGVNTGCYTKFADRPAGETDEGLPVHQGIQVNRAPISFRIDGCVKYAYPHAHDHVVLFALEDVTHRRTLLRTSPMVNRDGSLMGFAPHQVFQDSSGFPVTTQGQYEMIMIHHRPLQDQGSRFGMANYILYLTPGPCPQDGVQPRDVSDNHLTKDPVHALDR